MLRADLYTGGSVSKYSTVDESGGLVIELSEHHSAS
jgi:hypothetical protein